MVKHDLRVISALLLLVLISAGTIDVLGQPSGASIVSNTTETPAVQAAGSISTAGGSFTTLILNSTTQNPRWKAYVGNITGELSLNDAAGQTIYDWDLTIITGEVFASRNNSITWGSIECANASSIEAEDTFLNITSTKVDSINRTFNNTVHQGFFVGGVSISSSTCPSIATYVNNTQQSVDESADFQEILLQSGGDVVYATLLENNAQGYDISKQLDFQMIVAENELNPTPTAYYFYAELG